MEPGWNLTQSPVRHASPTSVRNSFSALSLDWPSTPRLRAICMAPTAVSHPHLCILAIACLMMLESATGTATRAETTILALLSSRLA